MIGSLVLEIAQAATLTVGPSGSYATIGEAVAHADDLDTIAIEAGTYNESLYIDKHLFFTGQDAALVQWNGTGDEALEIGADVVVRLQGITFSNPTGRCIDHDGEGMLQVMDCTFTQCHTLTDEGGAIETDEAWVDIRRTTFFDNSALQGGHIQTDSRLHITQSQFFEGYAIEDGGALEGNFDSLEITLSAFFGNEAGASGGAIAADVDGPAYVLGVGFIDNYAAEDGGAVAAYSPDTWFDVYFSGFCGNHADGDGGGMHHDAPYSYLENVGFVHNSAGGAGGGLVFEEGGDHAFIWNSVFVENTSSVAGGLHTLEAPWVWNSIVADNTPDGWVADDPTTAHDHNLYSHGTQLSGLTLDSTEIVGDPMFVNVSEHCLDMDLHLQAGSPAIDSGDDDGPWDFDNTPPDMGYYGGPASPDADGDGDGTPYEYDCNDHDPDRHLGTDEVCNGIDDNCNNIDDGWDMPDAIDFVLRWDDDDEDGFGDPNDEDHPWCDLGYDGVATNDDDCDDTNDTIHPGAHELCDGIDNDCDPGTPDPLSGDWWPDIDGDGYGDENAIPISTCTPPSNYVSNGDDCDDTQTHVNPGAHEVCNGIDDNCTGAADEGLSSDNWFLDDDGDGYGAGAAVNDCVAPGADWVTQSGDCDDGSAHRYPNNPEVCDGIDNDCNSNVDNGLAFVDYFADSDGDGLGNGSAVLATCDGAPTGYVQTSGDCDDNDHSIGGPSTWFYDDDGDGFGDASVSQTACTAPPDHVADSTDCNDGDPTLNPATSWYLDHDGDGAGDPGDAQPSCTPLAGRVRDNTDCNDDDPGVQGTVSVWADQDGDGYGGGTPTLACNQSAGFVTNGDDCDDHDADAFPGAVWFEDDDGDGFGTPTQTATQCLPPNGYVGNDLDCLDTNPARNPNTLWYPDGDGDGLGGSGAVQQCANPGGHVLNSDDCNDNNGSVGLPQDRWPDHDLDGYGDASVSPESLCPTSGFVTNGDDCDDSDSALTPLTSWYPDADGDTWGANVAAVTQCEAPAGHVQRNMDCNDQDEHRNPGAQESCDTIDNDCNGLIDDDDPHVVGQVFWYRDADGDQFGRSDQATETCSPPAGYVAAQGDCDDTENSVYPGAAEACDLLDNDCDDHIDEDAVDLDWYEDLDGDGWGVGGVIATQCNPPPHAALQTGDCNDFEATIYPHNPELCDGLDNDCDGTADNGATGSLPYWPDVDQDQHGDQAATPTFACTPPAGMVQNDADCDDANANRNYGAIEICDAWDNDCDGQVNVGALDAFEIWSDGDGDGYGTDTSPSQYSCAIDPGYADNPDDCNDNRADANPGETEVCDGIDNNCDNVVDEGLANLPYWLDADQDGFGDPDLETVADGCDAPPFTADNPDDCDDTDPHVNPDATEVPDNGLDDDCDGEELVTPMDTGDTGLLDTDTPQDTDTPGEIETYRAPGLWFCSTASPMGWSPLLLVLPLLVRRRARD